jgi:alcohol dehydrogenase class IV
LRRLTSFRYLVPTEIVFGIGTISELESRSNDLGSKPFLVTGVKSAERTGLLRRLLRILPRATHFGSPENPDARVCDEGARLCRESRCDHVVAVGGGSAIDAAKAIAGLALNEGPCANFIGSEKFVRGALPAIAIPTTSGTGSEVTPYAVLSDRTENTKRTISARCLFPRTAILDPELTVTMPPDVTAHTGLDALSQAMEGYVSRKSTRMGDTLALEACEIVRQFLPRAFSRADDMDARSEMHYAAMLTGCIVAQSGTTLVHGMGYYYTVHRGVAHGLANALLLAPVFRFNATVDPIRVARLAEALGHPVEATPHAAGKAITLAIHAMLDGCGISPKAELAGIKSSDLAAYTDHIVLDPYRFKNQMGTVTKADVLRFFEESFAGI